ncbi:MAG: Lrp/AsnC family transcriptional regulator [archaeon]|nr:Lrp/AsnC family transcriptional regulator [Nanoarchaeota archaeon]
MARIDTKDKKILHELDMNARMPLTELARKVGLSRQVVEYRIKRMQKENIIFGAIAIFDSVVVGFNWYRVAFRLLNVTKEQKDAFLLFLKDHNHINWLGEVGGNWDLVMNFICKDNFEFNSIFEEIISKYGQFIRDYEVLIYVNVYDLQRKYILENKGERKTFHHEMKYNSIIHLDQLDKSIISELSKNSLISNIELGQKLNVAGNTIKNRINEMKKSKLLLGFRLFINPSSFGYKSHMLFLEITRLNLVQEKQLYNYLKTIPNITFIVKHIGKWRIGMEIETKDEKDFQDIFVDIRGKFSEIITNFESFPIFKDYVINYFPEGNF